MSYDIVASKEYFIEFIKHIRKSMKYEDKKNTHRIEEIFIDNRIDVYFNKEFWQRLSVFKFDDGFKIELSDDELNAAALILFHEIDLMQENNNIEVKKESKISKENIWHFNPDLAEYLPNGEIKRLQTIINHFNEEGLKIFEKTHKTLDIASALMEKCSYTKKEYEILYYYKFDNGMEIDLTEYDIDAIAKVIADED